MHATYIDHMGSDLTVVNAARVSFGKRKEVFDEKDARLINYLVKHGHLLPFRHPSVLFHFKAPLFVARQLGKHQVGMSWSEISRRYVTDDIQLYWPPGWRLAPLDKKQGSLAEYVEGSEFYTDEAVFYTRQQLTLYRRLLANGVAPEQARMVLPQNAYTEWHWTGTLLAWAHVWRLRAAPDTQAETRECVMQIGPTMERLFPVAWPALIANSAEG